MHREHPPARARLSAVFASLSICAAHAAAAPACTLSVANDAQIAAQNGFTTLAPGSTVCIAPGTYAATFAIVGTKGTAAAPVTFIAGPQPGPVRLTHGLLLRGASHVTVSGLAVSLEPSLGPWAAVILDKGTSDSTISGLTVENSFVGICVGSGDGPAGAGNDIVDNISRNHWNTGIDIDRSDGTAANPTRVRRNRVSGNGGHGIDTTDANYVTITDNLVTGNGTGVRAAVQGGYSGIHLFASAISSASSPRGPRCMGNVIASNKVEGTLERPFGRPCNDGTGSGTCADGNGIQVDRYCSHTAVYANTTTGNAGDGINIYGASTTSVHDNFSYGNNQQAGRGAIFPGPAEIAVTAINMPAGSAANNTVYNNVAVTTVHKVPAFYVSDNAGHNTLGPNNTWRWAPESDPGWTWGPVYIGTKWYSTGADVDAVTGTSANKVELQPR